MNPEMWEEFWQQIIKAKEEKQTFKNTWTSTELWKMKEDIECRTLPKRVADSDR
jgi:hypothetical protein